MIFPKNIDPKRSAYPTGGSNFLPYQNSGLGVNGWQ
jgi:hypothetical protein